MRYHEAGLKGHADDTSTIINFRRNVRMFLNLLPKGALFGGTRKPVWEEYFADLTDRMRDANSTVSNLWLMIRDKNERIEEQDRALNAMRGLVRSWHSRWATSKDTMEYQNRKVTAQHQRIEDLESEIVGLVEQVQLGHSDLAAARRTTKVVEIRAGTWKQGCKRVVAERNEARSVAGYRQRLIERLDRLLLNAYSQRDEERKLNRTLQGRVETLRANLEDTAGRNVRLHADVRALRGDLDAVREDYTAAETQVNNLRKRNDVQCDMIRSAVAELKGRGDMYASLTKAIDILEGRAV